MMWTWRPSRRNGTFSSISHCLPSPVLLFEMIMVMMMKMMMMMNKLLHLSLFG